MWSNRSDSRLILDSANHSYIFLQKDYCLSRFAYCKPDFWWNAGLVWPWSNLFLSSSAAFMCSRQAGEGSGSYLPNEDFYKLWLLLTSVLTLFARQTVFQVTSWCSCFPASCEIISISMTSIIFTKWRKLKNKAGFATIWWRSLH